ETGRPVVVTSLDRILQRLSLRMALDADVVGVDRIEPRGVDDVRARGVRDVRAARTMAPGQQIRLNPDATDDRARRIPRGRPRRHRVSSMLAGNLCDDLAREWKADAAVGIVDPAARDRQIATARARLRVALLERFG